MSGSAPSTSSSSYPLLLWVALFGALFGSLQFGYHQGVLNTAWPQLANVFQYYDVNSWYTSVINFSYLTGAACGSLGAGSIADVVGPKKALFLNCFVFVAGGVVSAFSVVGQVGVIMFSVGRFLSGIGAGGASLLSPRYIAEISPVAFRGVLGTMNQLFICIGIVIAFLAGLPYQTEGDNVDAKQWRYMLILSAIIPLLQMCILSFIPESPQWLVMKGKYQSAQTIEQCLYGDNKQSQEPLLKNGKTNDKVGEPVSLRGLFSRKYSMFLTLGISVIVFQQLSGINTVVMYSTTVFDEVNLNNAVLASVITGVINVVGTLISSSLVEKAGRKVLLLISHAGMFLTLGYIALIQFLPFKADSSVASYSAFASILLYVIFFAIGSGPIPWLYVAEIMPAQIKGKAAAIATSLNWTFCIVIIAAFPLMLSAIGTGPSYGIFAGLNIVAFVYLLLNMVETKQIPIEEIEKKLLIEDKPESETSSSGV